MAEDRLSVQIRFAAPEDAPAIAAVLHASFIEYKSSYTDEAFAATAPTSDQIRYRMNEGPVWVAVIENVIVGTVSVVPRGEALYIRGMAVLPATRGKRAGEGLLRCVESFALTHGHERLVLSTTPFLARAIRLYERMGYRRSGGGPHELFGTPLVTMEKQVTPAEPPRSSESSAPAQTPASDPPP
jgi:GNAT superfamily N-acetyltransferase